METEKDINARILDLMTRIQNDHPELMPYIGEIPVTIPTDASPEINNSILQDYYESLNLILTNHLKNRPQDEA